MNFYLRFRNGRQRLALLLAVVFGTILLVFLMHNTHGKMVALQERASDCEQKQESLSAQLQVFVEHKGRLEKGLQQEKLNHKQTKDKLEAQYEELQELIEKEKSEASAKYSALQQQFKRLQDKSEDQLVSLQEELKRIQDLNKDLMDNQMAEVSKLNAQMDALKMTKDSQIVEIQGELNKVREERIALLQRLDQRSGFDQLDVDLKSCQKSLESALRGSSSVDVPSNIENKQVKVNWPKQLPADVRHGEGNVVGNSVPRLMSPHHVSKISDHVVSQNASEIAKNVGPAPDIHNHEQHNAADNEKHYDAFAGVHQIPQPNHNENNIEPVVEVKHHMGQIDDPVMEHNLDKPHVEVPQQSLNRNIGEGHHEEREEGPKVGDIGPGADGLEQQENGEDQDLDNMDNDVAAIGKKGNQQFEDADFDQAGDQVENEDVNIVHRNENAKHDIIAHN